VTEIIIEDYVVKGVKYLEGWNIYQTGINPSCEKTGYGVLQVMLGQIQYYQK